MNLHIIFDINIKKDLSTSEWLRFKNEMVLQYTYYNEISLDRFISNLYLLRELLVKECIAKKDSKEELSFLKDMKKEVGDLIRKYLNLEEK